MSTSRSGPARAFRSILALLGLAASLPALVPATLHARPQEAKEAKEAKPDLRASYTKREVRIPMRDGVRLFTAIYSPKDGSSAWPFLMRRTPYSCRPYGPDQFPDKIGPSEALDRDGYIFVIQDVRGRFMSQGEFVDVRPERADKTSKQATDESTDAFDTIEWLLANVEGHNGKVGIAGISYPGFYAAAGMVDAHPALAAVSPQAPIADWFFDDFKHHGAFFLPHFFNFYATFGVPRKGPTTEWPPNFEHGTPDGYQFFLDLGPLSNVDERYYKGGIAFWQDVVAHPDRDAFWQARDLRPRLKNVAPAVLTVGGWYDAEDLFGALAVYRSVEEKNPGIYNALVMGPWSHGGWARTKGQKLGHVSFGTPTSEHFQEAIELPFFRRYLKGEEGFSGREAYVFETGRNRWRTFEAWPPPGAEKRSLHLAADEALVAERPAEAGKDSFVSDPKKPVPHTQAITVRMDKDYMVEDQRFAARRPDVLVYRTEPLPQAVTIAGPLVAELHVATTLQDADWVVKLIDVLPDDAKEPEGTPAAMKFGGYQMMVRSEVFRGRYREDYAKPKPFVPNEVAVVRVPLQDVLHTFEPGHRIMIQVQSTWFPLVDRNPQKWVDNVFLARPEDFQAATHSVHRGGAHASRLEFSVLPEER